jgi:hypothetical protein
VPQSQRLRQEYLRIVDALLRAEREDLERALGRSPGALERHLEWIERAQQATAELEGAQAMEPAADRDRVAVQMKALRNADHLLQPTLDAVAADVDEGIAHARLRVPVETYTCTLPTGTFNAQARAVGGGVLIIVNTGLVTLLFGAAQILAHAVNVGGRVDLGRALYTDTQLSDAFADLLVAHVVRGDARESNWFTPQGGWRKLLADALWHPALVFGVAHEFGHVIAEHHHGPVTQRPESVFSDLDVVARSIEQEREADQIAGHIVSSREGVDTDPSAASMVAAGPAIFFALAQSTDLVAEPLVGRRRSPHEDHPPPMERWAAVRSQLQQRLPRDSFELARNLQGWIEEATRAAIATFEMRSTGAP